MRCGVIAPRSLLHGHEAVGARLLQRGMGLLQVGLGHDVKAFLAAEHELQDMVLIDERGGVTDVRVDDLQARVIQRETCDGDHADFSSSRLGRQDEGGLHAGLSTLVDKHAVDIPLTAIEAGDELAEVRTLLEGRDAQLADDVNTGLIEEASGELLHVSLLGVRGGQLLRLGGRSVSGVNGGEAKAEGGDESQGTEECFHRWVIRFGCECSPSSAAYRAVGHPKLLVVNVHHPITPLISVNTLFYILQNISDRRPS